MNHQRILRYLCIVVACVLLTLGLFWNTSALADDAGGSASGKIVARSETTIDVRGDKDQQAVRYLLPVDLMHDPKSLAFIKSLAVGDQVQLTWTPFRGHRLVTNIRVTKGAASEGTLVTGTVTDMQTTAGKMIWIEIKDDAGKTEQYSPVWAGHGLDKEMTAAIARRNIGDRVEIHTTKDDHVRVITMRVLALAPETARKPNFEGGKIVGRVTARSTDSVTIKPEGGEALRFVVQRIVGTKDELDPAVVKEIGAVKVGEPVEGEWFGDGQRRLISLERAGSAATRPATDSAPAP